MVGCKTRLEKDLVGNWRECYEGCSILSLRPDHTFSERFDEENSTDTYYSGTWSIEGDQLVTRITWAMEMFKELVGQENRVIIAEFRRNSFVTASLEDKSAKISYKWVH